MAPIVAWPFDRAAAREYGILFAELRRIGRPMQQMDIQIAAIAIHHRKLFRDYLR
jgi:tRNA(fMet)-specific endonuclease VapC